MTSRETLLKNKLYRESYYRENISQKMTLSRKYYRETIYREKHSYYRDTLSRKLKILKKLSYSNDFDKRFIEKVRSRYIFSKYRET